ncbi:hypothetical protein NDU88_002175 [Pleurodeles waltl]|uniref:Hypervirulence associated protein TUDOR domain-containing protein n=1 Tax=Pleurodeles waltl TaxID=8319 RepID=A0AAV7LBU4_PLEWA|nr:hypothetical protein NDU88_002175 [Pleurodeles waltl]
MLLDPAQNNPNWRWPHGVHKGNDGLHRFPDADEAETLPENPDIRVPSGTKREGGQRERIEDAEEQGSKESGGNQKEPVKKADDDRRQESIEVPREAAEQRRKEKNGVTLTDRHAPGGTWLTKNNPNWRWPSGIHEGNEGLHRFPVDDDIETLSENPDIRVPSGTKREGGQRERIEEEDAEEQGSKESGGNQKESGKKADDDRRQESIEVPREAAEQRRKEKNGVMLTDRHASGGT